MVKLVSITPEAEHLISYCARVSNPSNQENYNSAPKLLGYLIKHAHWSPYEMANMVVEIETARDISPQILRHRSFSFQEFSQRYAEADLGFEQRKPRAQDLKNKQNSTDTLNEETKEWFNSAQTEIQQKSFSLYKEALSKGIAKECARSLLTSSVTTRLYMNGTIRSWIHYCILRCEKGTQLEHRLIANDCWKLIRQNLPNVAKAVEEQYDYLKVIQ